jgi:hypothetical protein
MPIKNPRNHLSCNEAATEKIEKMIKPKKSNIFGDKAGWLGASYTAEQVVMIAEVQTEKYALATEIAHAAGLRAHELIKSSPRPWGCFCRG